MTEKDQDYNTNLRPFNSNPTFSNYSAPLRMSSFLTV